MKKKRYSSRQHEDYTKYDPEEAALRYSESNKTTYEEALEQAKAEHEYLRELYEAEKTRRRELRRLKQIWQQEPVDTLW